MFTFSIFQRSNALVSGIFLKKCDNNIQVFARTFICGVQKTSESKISNVKLCSKNTQSFGFTPDLFNRYYCSPVRPANVNLFKKRAIKKRYSVETESEHVEGRFPVVAFATANEYHLENLKIALIQQKLYKPQKLFEHDLPNVLFTSANYSIGNEPRHMFFFREGGVVMWNCTDLEISNVLAFLKAFEEESYTEDLILREKELMFYSYQLQGKKCQLHSSTFMLNSEPENILEKYTFSNAMAQSVKLGIWESTLDRYADTISSITDDLQWGKPLTMTREEVLRKTGVLYALRHHINLESDLLDTPDFYWEQPELERLYLDTVRYFSVARRTKVFNEKLSHCAELVELVASHLSDRHHVRLEWMIIILIMVEVGFETLHFIERYS